MKPNRNLKKLEWIAKLTPENCPGGLPADEEFLEEGGFTERLYRKRTDFRRKRGPRHE